MNRIIHYPGLFITILVGAGLWKAYKQLPIVTAIPDIFFEVLVLISIIGICYHKKSYNSLYPIATLLMATNWLFIQTSFIGILQTAETITSNPYIKTDPLLVAKIASYTALMIGISVFLFSARLLYALQMADPLYKPKEEYRISFKGFWRETLKRWSKIKALAKNIKTIWQLESWETSLDGQMPIDKRMPISRRIRGIILYLIKSLKSEEKPYSDFVLRICEDLKTGKDINLGFLEMFLHILIIGPTGCGKTSRIIKPIAWQIIKYIILYKHKKGQKFGLTIIEPKGDLAEDVAKWCKKLNIPYTHVDPLRQDSAKINPLQGDAQTAAESTRMVLRKLFGRQEAFFAQVQETSARNVILLLKHLKGDNLDLSHVVRTLRDQERMNLEVLELQNKLGEGDDLVQYFQKEVLGALKNEYQKFAMGLRMHLEDLLGDKLLRRIITGDSDINFDTHLEEGGILLVNTAMGQLGKLGDAFGTFVIMHLQNAVFRRPGNEWTRTPHVLIVDEASRYINPDFERLLAIGRSFRCSCVLAIQSLGQLELEEKLAFKNIVLTNCRNKIVFGGLEAKDAKTFEQQFGEVETNMVQSTFEHRLVLPNVFPKNFRTTKNKEPRYSFTEIMELGEFAFLYRLMEGAQYQPVGVGVGQLIDPELDFPKRKKTDPISKGTQSDKQLPVDNQIKFIAPTLNEVKPDDSAIKAYRNLSDDPAQTEKVKKQSAKNENKEKLQPKQPVQAEQKTKKRRDGWKPMHQENQENKAKEETS